MVTDNSLWRTTDLPLDAENQVVVVFGRSKLLPGSAPEIIRALDYWVEECLRFPGLVGIQVRVDEPHNTLWSVTAWTDYESLENFTLQFLEALREAARKGVGTKVVLRHSGYRRVLVGALPPRWTDVEKIISEVEKASPLGADAFPELYDLVWKEDAEET